MDTSPPFFDEIFALWQNEAAMATDLGVSRGCARRWIVRGYVPIRHWPALTVACRTRFGLRLSQMLLAAAFLDAKDQPPRKFPKVQLYPRYREAQAA